MDRILSRKMGIIIIKYQNKRGGKENKMIKEKIKVLKQGKRTLSRWNNFKKSSKGITLIALVITIIVLLILAGVSIATLTGQNGILTRAQDAKEQTERTQIIEQAKLDILKKQTDNVSAELEKSEIKDVLDIYFKEVPDNFTSDTVLTTKEEYGNYEITVSEIYGGKIEEKGLTATDIANAENKEEFYGAEVKNYTTANDSKAHADGWKIFYAGTMGEETTPHIYLIASDYIEYQYIPYSTKDGSVTTNKPNQGNSSYPRTAYFTNILKDYTGSASITDSKIQALNYSYFSQNFTSTNNNMKAVAYMLDTDAWIDFAGAKAEYAIGGPTVEMLMNSYNQKYGEDYRIPVTGNTGYFGYQNLKTNDSLYVINSTSNAVSMWIASPGGNNPDYLFGARNSGLVNTSHDYDYEYSGFRPLVCLEYNVELQKNTDESGEVYYMIKSNA